MQKAVVGGILTIVSSVMGIITGLFIAAVPLLFKFMLESDYYGFTTQEEADVLAVMGLVYAGIGIIFVLIGVLGIVGGVFTLKRKLWGLALTGAIAGSILFYPLGIVAVILVSMAQPEFRQASAAALPQASPLK
jgi:membrane protease YdiL (CAAX protease family)